MTIYTITRHYPDAGIRCAYPDSTRAMQHLKRMARDEDLILSDDGWEAHDKLLSHNLYYEIEETWLFDVNEPAQDLRSGLDLPTES